MAIDNRWTKSGTTMHDFDGWEIEFVDSDRPPLTCASEDLAKQRSVILDRQGIKHRLIHITNVTERTPVEF